MAAKPTKRVPNWTCAAASRTLPYIRLVLRDLRECYIAIWHLFRMAGYDLNNPDYRERFRLLGEAGQAALKKLDHLGVIPYQSPLRGIALFPFSIQDDQGGTPQEAYFVFKDTRDSIDSYILQDDLGENGDLYGDEKPVPVQWREPGRCPPWSGRKGDEEAAKRRAAGKTRRLVLAAFVRPPPRRALPPRVGNGPRDGRPLPDVGFRLCDTAHGPRSQERPVERPHRAAAAGRAAQERFHSKRAEIVKNGEIGGQRRTPSRTIREWSRCRCWPEASFTPSSRRATTCGPCTPKPLTRKNWCGGRRR